MSVSNLDILRYQEFPTPGTLNVQRPQKKHLRALSATARKLVGFWTLVTSYDKRPNGETVLPRGDMPKGSLVYERSGRMTVQIMPQFGSLNPSAVTSKDPGPALTDYTAYFGKFKVNERERSVTHHLEGSLDSREVGKTRTRFYQLCGDRLTLTTPAFEVDGEERVRYMIWERVG